MKNLVKIKKALISLSDKSDLKKILDNLNKYKIEIISSGGTYKEIKKLGFSCKEISDYTGFKEMLDGRIKTLHPKIHAGILSIRNNKKHQKQLKYNNYGRGNSYFNTPALSFFIAGENIITIIVILFFSK
jgi:phosphoribosylaminoimidazolecarboxamide formyltransferase/IMP cyclohydrolase